MTNVLNGPLPDRVIWEPVFRWNDQIGEYGLHIKETKTGQAIGAIILQAYAAYPSLQNLLDDEENVAVAEENAAVEETIDDTFIPIKDPEFLHTALTNFVNTSPYAYHPFIRIDEKNGLPEVADIFTKDDSTYVTKADVARQIKGEIEFWLDPNQEWD